MRLQYSKHRLPWGSQMFLLYYTYQWALINLDTKDSLYQKIDTMIWSNLPPVEDFSISTTL